MTFKKSRGKAMGKALGLGAATVLSVTLMTAPTARAIDLAEGYTPKADNPTCLFNICGEAWGLGFDYLAVAPRHKIWLDNGGKTGGLTAGSVSDALEKVGVQGSANRALDAIGFIQGAKNFFGSPQEVGRAYQAEVARHAQKKGLDDAKVKELVKELGTWGNFVKGAEIYGLSKEKAKEFGELRRPFLDRVEHVGTERALRELFAALDALKEGKELSWGPVAIGSSLPGGAIGSTSGFHPADNVGGLAGGSSGLASGSS